MNNITPREELFNIHRGHIASILTQYAGQDDKALDKITNYMMEKISHVIRKERKKRELYRRVASSILEQIFDPLLEFKLTKKDILDTFEANDMEREKVSNQQINQIYVKVLHKLKVGKLRDLTLEQLLHQYVRLKLEEINFSRQDWELNGR